MKKLLKKVNMELSLQEEKFVKQLLSTREIPYPKLPIKDHNTINKKGGILTRLVIPVTNFTATLSKIGYLGIKIMLEKEEVNY